MKRNELEEIWQGIIDGFNEAIEEAKATKEANEPTTVEELDEAIPDIPNLKPEQTNPTTTKLPKWKAAELGILDVINTRLQTDKTIDPEAAMILKILAETRDTICRHH